MKKIIFILPVLLLLCSCAETVNIIENYKLANIDYKKIKEGKITFAGTRHISLSEFQKTFKDVYSDTTILNKKLYDCIVEDFKKYKLNAQIISDTKNIPEELFSEGKVHTEDVKKVKEYFLNCKSDYVLVIKNFEIDHNYEYSGPKTGSQEICVVNITFAFWDVANQNKIISATASGKGRVVLWSFSTALNTALENAMENAIIYVSKNGTPEFQH